MYPKRVEHGNERVFPWRNSISVSMLKWSFIHSPKRLPLMYRYVSSFFGNNASYITKVTLGTDSLTEHRKVIHYRYNSVKEDKPDSHFSQLTCMGHPFVRWALRIPFMSFMRYSLWNRNPPYLRQITVFKWRFGSLVSFLIHISLKMTTDNSIVTILWIVFLLYIVISCCKGIKVVHQGTFMIVEHFGKFSVGCS